MTEGVRFWPVTPVTVTPVNFFGGLRTSHIGCLIVKVVLTSRITDSYKEPCVQISYAILILTWFSGEHSGLGVITICVLISRL